MTFKPRDAMACLRQFVSFADSEAAMESLPIDSAMIDRILTVISTKTGATIGWPEHCETLLIREWADTICANVNTIKSPDHRGDHKPGGSDNDTTYHLLPSEHRGPLHSNLLAVSDPARRHRRQWPT